MGSKQAESLKEGLHLGEMKYFHMAVFAGLVQLSEEPNPPQEMDLQIHHLHWKASRIPGQGENKQTQGIALATWHLQNAWKRLPGSKGKEAPSSMGH